MYLSVRMTRGLRRGRASAVLIRLLGVGALLLASACGGGGGGGGGGGFVPVAGVTPTPTSPDSSLKVTFDTATLTMTYQMGATTPSEAVVNAVAEGTPSSGLFVRATSPDGQSDPNLENAQVSVTGRSARIAIKPKAGLPPGVYKGTLVFQACPDSACAVNYVGSPWTVSYTLTVTMVYAALDTSGFGVPKTMVYDAAHGDIYASYPTPYGGAGHSAIVRFRSGAAGWTGSALSIPGLRDIALATDGSVLAATDASGKVNLVDLASFSVKSSHASPAGIGDQGNMEEVGIAFTNDGKLWMSTGTGTGWHGLGYFDLRTSTFGNATPACAHCYGSQFFAVSGDGSRLMVTQSAAISPQPPMLYMDAADDIMRPNPVGLTFFYYLTSLSANGDRFLMMGNTVYDRAFGTVGRIPPPPKGVRAAQMSPDGRRAYVLTYAVEPGDSSPPVVQLFDTSVQAGTQLNLPQVGSFTIPDMPGCQTASYPNYDCYRPKMRLTPDGNNLLILGTRKLIVAPIPKELTGLTSKPADSLS
jgi:hypothetical protein